MEVKLLSQPNSEGERLGDFIKTQLRNDKWTGFKTATAFLKMSGIQHFHRELKEFAKGREVKMIAGVDLGGTSIEAINLLRESLNDIGELWIFHNENSSTFHPKIYVFYSEDEAIVVIGSGNLTQGGIFTNYEVSVAINLNLVVDKDLSFFCEVSSLLDEWSINGGENAKILNDTLFNELIENGYLLPEKTIAVKTSENEVRKREYTKANSLFKSTKVAPAPELEYKFLIEQDLGEPEITITDVFTGEQEGIQNNVFLMTLQKTDVGVGQTTSGKSRRSPEIFIPLAARDSDPEFWGWNGLFTEDPEKPGKFDRRAVPMCIDGEIIEVNMMTWPDRSDFRLRSEVIRSAGNIGDILKIESCNGDNGYHYIIEIIPADSSSFNTYDALCNVPVRAPSLKRWGLYTSDSNRSL